MTTSVRSKTCPGCGVTEGEKHYSSCALWGIDGSEQTEQTEPAKLPTRSIVVSIPPEVDQYAPDILRFVDAMVYKLGVKAHKGKWETMTLQVALELLRGEEKELTEAVERGNMVEIMLEAADVANFALIASAIAMEKK